MKNNYGTSSLVKEIKFKIPKDRREFLSALDDLERVKYHSSFAEKRRVYQKNKKIKIWMRKEKRENIVNVISSSYIYSISNNIPDLTNNTVGEFRNSFGRYQEYSFDPKKNYFWSQYIEDDVIYTDTFQLSKGRNGSAKLIVKRVMKTPFPLEYYSQKSFLAKWTFSNSFKKYTLDIRKGIVK